MFSYLLFSLFPILFALSLGWGIGKFTTSGFKQSLVSYITILVWLLLISIGFQFGAVLFDPQLGTKIIFQAIIYSTILVIVTYLILFKKDIQQQKDKKAFSDIIKPILECLVAIAMVVIGMILYMVLSKSINGEWLSTILLYILILLVGVDFSSIKLQSLTFNHFRVPFLTITALFISAYLTTFILDKSFVELMVLGSGFGWFSLSGPLVAKVMGTESGTFALICDLIREFYAIALLYLLGRKYPAPIIGICGATAMDSTLPFIKNNCTQLDVQIAIFSGFILTLLAPCFIILFSQLFYSFG
ncbi:lysine exporter LysO family protein [Acinetobacter qingfengensis]|uniref:Uncharacterized protein n=1 Tax=Acinetobacter qingfengensis TaxID=1262585 RepID=A0A1E7R3H5_9GAMM|nr:LysO family transporter [Acinetobacter qingfengensis]KAA8733181.1 lysine exporter LysO family protein [Acinetobacter qingfengensis]OEY93846.1 hypothetical protein BJI46_13955 [Acinetobacter qingfengensis]